MGHKNPDNDSFGAALGISRIANTFERKPYIVIGEYQDMLAPAIDEAKDSRDGFRKS